MANPDLIRKELQFLRRMICKGDALAMIEGQPEAKEELREVGRLVHSLKLLVTLRSAWAELLEDEPEGWLH